MSNRYLEDLLASQRLDETSEEWKALDAEAEKIEGILRAAYPKSVLMFTHGGSRASWQVRQKSGSTFFLRGPPMKWH